ncbi:hypothetical protein FACS1894111_07260 [Clostridia bacterium]|nr:hypothetical protein FACS1894111_07260 [Clostridia bacterium]
MKTAKRTVVAFLSFLLCLSVFSACGKKALNDTLIIGTGKMDGQFNQLFYKSNYDHQVVELTNMYVYDTGKGGELVDGACFYKAPQVVSDEAGNQHTIYTFRLREGLVFSDGTPVTADDIIFTYKCESSFAYDGVNSLAEAPLSGLLAYRYDTPDYAAVSASLKQSAAATEEEILAAAAMRATNEYDDNLFGPQKMLDTLGIRNHVNINKKNITFRMDIPPNLEEGSSAYRRTLISIATDIYSSEYRNELIPSIEKKKERELSLAYLTDKVAESEEVSDISGIVKLDDYTVQVTADGVDASLEYQLGSCPIMSQQYYSQGINKVDFSAMKAKLMQPLGGGAYILEKYSNKTAYLTANPSYYKGTPEITHLQLTEVSGSDKDKLTALKDKTVNVLLDVDCSPDNKELAEENLSYCMTYDRNGWGYIGISAKLIPDINIRKALMSLIARELSLGDYYEGVAVVLERPITMASWGYPINDNAPVYDYDKNTALEYFAKAGYTLVKAQPPEGEENAVAKDRLVDATGEPLSMEAYIPDDSHPASRIFKIMRYVLEDMGATFDLINVSGERYYNQYMAGDCMLWGAAYGGTTADPDCYKLFHSDSIMKGTNPFYLNDPEVDRMIMEGRSLVKREERIPIYEKLFDRIMDDAVVMPYYQRLEMNVIDPKVVDIGSLPKDPDPFCGLLQKIETLKLVQKK